MVLTLLMMQGHHYFCMEKGVLEEFAPLGYDFQSTNGRFYQDLMKLFKALNIVDNNAPNNVGLAPLAPPIGN